VNHPLMNATAKIRANGAPDRQKDDWYVTPPASTESLLAVETFPREIWEPACGDGAISKVLAEHDHRVISSDLMDRGFGEPGIDFLMEYQLRAPAIVTNPPFKLADEFALHALSLKPEKLAIFQRLAWLEGDRRRRVLWDPHPPARLWIFSKRQTLRRGDDPDARSSGGAIPFAWYVWERGFSGAPSLGWLE